jgi:hypothetical protein
VKKSCGGRHGLVKAAAWNSKAAFLRENSLKKRNASETFSLYMFCLWNPGQVSGNGQAEILGSLEQTDFFYILQVRDNCCEVLAHGLSVPLIPTNRRSMNTTSQGRS